MPIKTRELREADKPLVYSTMLRGLYYGCSYFGQINKQTFFQNYAKVVDKLLDVADVHIACLSEDEDVIIGFAITRPNIIDFCYVKPPFRKQGVARLLVGDKPVQYITHITLPGAAIAKSKGWKLDPWLL